jgi:hypothetical protein
MKVDSVIKLMTLEEKRDNLINIMGFGITDLHLKRDRRQKKV